MQIDLKQINRKDVEFLPPDVEILVFAQHAFVTIIKIWTFI